jgi:hypothetical protein
MEKQSPLFGNRYRSHDYYFQEKEMKSQEVIIKDFSSIKKQEKYEEQAGAGGEALEGAMVRGKIIS